VATFRVLAAILSIAGLGMAGLASPAHADDFYAKKSITMIVGGNPGGGYDL
jgi:tripartite-type tricarboxylate transporter receptor subunit TctC